MTWVLLAILTAFFESLRDVFNKKNLRKFDEYIVTWILASFTALFLVPLVLLTGMPELNPEFWVALFVSGSLNTIAFFLFIRAIKSADLSLVAPMTAFTPFFLLMTSPLIVGEFPKPISLVGVLLVVLGSYIVNLDRQWQGYLAPFRALLNETGPRLALIVAFLWSITSTVDKIGVLNSAPLFWVMSVYGFIAIALLPITLYKWRYSFRQLAQQAYSLIAIGLFNSIAVALQMITLKLTLVIYAIAIKRNSVVFSVLFGYFFFREGKIVNRIIGAIVMVLGAIAIAIS